MRARAILAMVVATLTLCGTAGGFVMGRVFTINPGDRADFFKAKPGTVLGWSCFNTGTSVRCQSGDAFPYVDLTSTRPGGVTVRVHTLRDPQGGHLTRTYEKGGYPVYVFTAF